MKNLVSVCFILNKNMVGYGLGKLFRSKSKLLSYIKVFKNDILGVCRE